MVTFEDTYGCETLDTSYQRYLQGNVTKLYSLLEPTQKSFFEREMIPPQVLMDQSGPWREPRIVDYIAKNWGETSIPMQYYNSVFGLSSSAQTTDTSSVYSELMNIQPVVVSPKQGLEYRCK